MNTPFQTGHAPVNGLQIYFEIHGMANPARPPLVLLHGGGDTVKTSFGYILPELARERQIIAFEQQGYGHTADIAERPFSFEQLADDTAGEAPTNYRRLLAQGPALIPKQKRRLLSHQS